MTYLLNILDLLLTTYAISHGAWELNPVMQSIPFMIFYKVIVLGILCWFLEYMAKRNRVARVGRKICLFAFLAVDLWHIYNLIGGNIYG
jgi:hypothetical protein